LEWTIFVHWKGRDWRTDYWKARAAEELAKRGLL
jgi:hypothetical protein